MKNNEIFESKVNSDGSLAGVYEHDDEVGYFYLYDLMHPVSQKVIGAVRVSLGLSRQVVDDLAIRWNRDETAVGLFNKNKMLAAFDVMNQEAFGGESDGIITIPDSIKNSFSRESWTDA
jgi:hypothetical protein